MGMLKRKMEGGKMGSIGMLMPAVVPVQKWLVLGKEEKFCQ
jgi:hypothetical protein